MTASRGGGFPDWPAGGRRQLVETKVKWSTVGSTLGAAAVLAMLGAVSDDPNMLSPLPDALELLLLSLLPGLVSFVAGWRARHTPRPDLPPAQR